MPRPLLGSVLAVGLAWVAEQASQDLAGADPTHSQGEPCTSQLMVEPEAGNLWT